MGKGWCAWMGVKKRYQVRKRVVTHLCVCVCVCVCDMCTLSVFAWDLPPWLCLRPREALHMTPRLRLSALSFLLSTQHSLPRSHTFVRCTVSILRSIQKPKQQLKKSRKFTHETNHISYRETAACSVNSNVFTHIPAKYRHPKKKFHIQIPHCTSPIPSTSFTAPPPLPATKPPAVTVLLPRSSASSRIYASWQARVRRKQSRCVRRSAYNQSRLRRKCISCAPQFS